jgi:hypothetical protein
MGAPIRSNALAAILHAMMGGSGEAYSLPLGEGRGPIVTREDASPHAVEHEQFHIDAGGPTSPRNGPYGSVDTAEFVPPAPRNLPAPLDPTRKPSPARATRMMDDDLENLMVQRRTRR